MQTKHLDYFYVIFIYDSATMAKHDSGRLAAIVVSVVGFGISLVFNALSVVGIGESEILFFFSNLLCDISNGHCGIID